MCSVLEIMKALILLNLKIVVTGKNDAKISLLSFSRHPEKSITKAIFLVLLSTNGTRTSFDLNLKLIE